MEHDWRTSITAIGSASPRFGPQRKYFATMTTWRPPSAVASLDAIVEESARLHRTCKRFAEVGQ